MKSSAARAAQLPTYQGDSLSLSLLATACQERESEQRDWQSSPRPTCLRWESAWGEGLSPRVQEPGIR